MKLSALLCLLCAALLPSCDSLWLSAYRAQGGGYNATGNPADEMIARWPRYRAKPREFYDYPRSHDDTE